MNSDFRQSSSTSKCGRGEREDCETVKDIMLITALSGLDFAVRVQVFSRYLVWEPARMPVPLNRYPSAT